MFYLRYSQQETNSLNKNEDYNRVIKPELKTLILKL